MSDNKIDLSGRNSRKYYEWRASVIKRDDFQCTECGAREKLHAHHIKTWKEFPELRFDIDNGKTVCAKCHGKIHWPDNTVFEEMHCKYLKQRYKDDVDFRIVVDTFMVLYEKSGFNELDFVAALNLHSHFKNEGKL